MPTTLENIVIDCESPSRLGSFWARALGGELTPDADGATVRVPVPGGFVLDLCFEPVTQPDRGAQRLHLDLLGGEQEAETVERLIGLGASPLDIGQNPPGRNPVPWTVLADPEGNAFCVLEPRDQYANTGPIAALPLDVAEPEAGLGF